MSAEMPGDGLIDIGVNLAHDSFDDEIGRAHV